MTVTKFILYILLIMKKLILFLSVFIVLLSCTPNPTEKQKEFAQKLLETPGILKTEWVTNLILNVTVNLDSLGLNPKMQAQLLADQIASGAVQYTEKDTCVRILYGDSNKLADSCVDK
ncbi:MAG: hypothetical protein ACRENZ_02745 [Thermodesulfobacteriota bacterium]